MCDCHSYNWLVGKTKEKVLVPPFGTKTVCVDACIAHVLGHIWKYGVITKGCCCGHNRKTPSIVLDDDFKDPEFVRNLISEVDKRDFELLTWRLVEI